MNTRINPEEIEVRKRRALYRASHRGTKEMDWLLGRYASAKLSGMGESELSEFEKLLAIADPDLESWIMQGKNYRGSAFETIISHLRQFHELDDLN